MKHIKRMTRFTVVPRTLYRIQAGETPILRNKAIQLSKGRTSFDFTPGQNKLYNPQTGDIYKGPNGLSLRPIGVNLAQLLDTSYQSSFVFELAQGLVVPEDTILIHQRSDHYSLQTLKPIKPQQFQQKVRKFFLQQTKRLTLEQLRNKVVKQLKQQ